MLYLLFFIKMEIIFLFLFLYILLHGIRALVKILNFKAAMVGFDLASSNATSSTTISEGDAQPTVVSLSENSSSEPAGFSLSDSSLKITIHKLN